MNSAADTSKVATQDYEKSALDPSKANSHVKSDDLSIQCPAHTTEAALVKRVDFKVLPMLVVLYMMAFLDR